MFDLNQILASFAQTAQQRSAGLEDQANVQSAATDQMVQSNAMVQDRTSQVIQARGAAAMQAAEIEYARNSAIEQAQRIIGLDPAQLDNEFAQSIAEMHAAEEQRKGIRAQYDELAGATLLSDPLKWLRAQVDLPGLAAQHNSAADARDAAVQNLQTRQSLLASQKSTVVAATADAARQLKLGEARTAAYEAETRLMAASAEAASSIASKRLNEFNLRDKAADVKGDYYSKVLSLEEVQARREERQEVRVARAEESRARLQNKTDQQAAEQVLNENLLTASSFMGLPTPITVETLKLMPKQQAEPFWQIAATGSLGASPLAVLQTINSIPSVMPSLRTHNPLVAQTVESVTAGVRSYKDGIQAKAQREGAKVTDKEAWAQADEAYADEVIKSANAPTFAKHLNHPAWDTTYNPFRVDHRRMAAIIGEGNAKFLEANPYVKAIGAIAATAPGDTLKGADENRALLGMAEIVKNRQMLPKDAAAAIVQYYSAGAQINKDQYQYGIFQFPKQERYMITLPAQGMFGRPVSADLLNPVSVTKMLLQLAGGSANRMVPNTGLLPAPGDPLGLFPAGE